jgi:hypothetical protein
MRVMKWIFGGLLLASLLAGAAAAQEDKEQPPQVRVQVVLREMDGDRIISRLPYTLYMKAEGFRNPAQLRTGLRVPILTMGQESRIQYQQVGTDIDFWADPLGGGRFNVRFHLSRSALFVPEGERQPIRMPGDLEIPSEAAPILSQFNSRLDLLLRDGQPLEAIVSSDPISGRTLRVDVTLTVVKEGGGN